MTIRRSPISSGSIRHTTLAPERRPRSKAEAARLLGLTRGVLDRRRSAIIKRFSGMSEKDLRRAFRASRQGRAPLSMSTSRRRIAKIMEFCGPIYDWRRDDVGLGLPTTRSQSRWRHRTPASGVCASGWRA